MRSIMKYRNILLWLAVLGLGIGLRNVRADENNSRVGTSVFNFLKIDMGARPQALAGAYTAAADDESAMYYNPAGVIKLEGRHFIAGYHNYVFDMQSGFLGYMHPLKNGQYLFSYINYLNYGEFIRADDAGVSDGTFSGGDMLFAVGYSRRINDNISVGIAGKLIYEKIDAFSASAVAFDLGVRHESTRGRTVFGAAIQNLGFQLQSFIDGGVKDPLPLRFRVGASHRPKGLPVMIAVDGILPRDNDPYAAIGVEYLEIKPLFLRVGWSSFGSNYKTDSSKDDLAGFSVGFGVDYKKLNFSYALSPQSELGTSHRLTISGGFDTF